MKVTYVSNLNLDSKDGVTKKILSQIKSIEKIVSKRCDYIVKKNNHNFFLYSELNIEKKISKNQNKILLDNYFLFRNLKRKKMVKKTAEQDYVYVRHTRANKKILNFFADMKKKDIGIILEIPTYPYDEESSTNIFSTFSGYIDRHYRKQYKKYVDYIVTFSDDQEIWGIPCINISNGIDLESTKLINKVEDDTITFTSVSICAPWHGLDRFLNSLETYLEQTSSVQVKFNIVGEGVETPKLKQIVNDSKHLKDVVVFHGFRSGEELDAIYNETDIAVGSLGRHRSGLISLKTLKNREYAAKGLPMIYSEMDTDFEGKPFVYKVTPNEALIDLDKIIVWHQNLEMRPEEIREYAKQFSWDTQMKKVIDAIEEI